MTDPLARRVGKSVPIGFTSLEACMGRPPARTTIHEELAEMLLLEFREHLAKPALWSDAELLAALTGCRIPLCLEEGVGRLTLMRGQREAERVALECVESELVRRRVLSLWDLIEGLGLGSVP